MVEGAEDVPRLVTDHVHELGVICGIVQQHEGVAFADPLGQSKERTILVEVGCPPDADRGCIFCKGRPDLESDMRIRTIPVQGFRKHPGAIGGDPARRDPHRDVHSKFGVAVDVAAAVEVECYDAGRTGRTFVVGSILVHDLAPVVLGSRRKRLHPRCSSIIIIAIYYRMSEKSTRKTRKKKLFVLYNPTRVAPVGYDGATGGGGRSQDSF